MQLAWLSLIVVANLHRWSLSWKQQHIFLLLVWSRPETLDLKDPSQYGGRSKRCRRLQSSDPTWNSKFLLACIASISIWFWGMERPRNRIVGFGRMRIGTRARKWERGEGRGRKETLPYLSSPPPHLSFTRTIFLVPRSSLRNRMETLAMQANFLHVTLVKLWFYKTKQFADFKKFW